MRSLLGVLLVCSALLGAGAASAQGSDEAREAFQQGIDAFGERRYEEAREAFVRANELSPSWKLLYNIGQCEAALKRYGLALTHFEQYLSEGGDNLTTERRDEVLAEVERLRKMVGSLEVTAPAGAIVVVDGVERGTAPLPGRLRVAASVEHQLVIRLGDRVLLDRTVMAGGGENLKFEVSAEGAEEPVDEATEPDEGGSGLHPAGWVVLGVGAALLVGGGVTGGVALSKNGELADSCPDGVCQPGKQGEIDSRDALAMTSNVLLGVGAAAAVAGVLMLVLMDGDEEPGGADVALAPVAGPGAAGLTAEWRF
jgi:hypothetical protein